LPVSSYYHARKREAERGGAEDIRDAVLKEKIMAVGR